MISSVLHELGHASAASYYGCEVGDLGIGLYLFKPVFYTDLSKAWVLNRKKRVITDLSGIYFQILTVNVLAVLGLFFKNSELRVAMLSVIILAIINLNPFLRLDGYWILSDWLGIVNINKRAFDSIKYAFKKIIFKRDIVIDNKINLTKGRRIILNAYMSIYLVFTFAALSMIVYLTINLLQGNLGIVSMINDFIRAFTDSNISEIYRTFNKLLMTILPYIYLVMFLSSLGRSLIKGKLKVTKE